MTIALAIYAGLTTAAGLVLLVRREHRIWQHRDQRPGDITDRIREATRTR